MKIKTAFSISMPQFTKSTFGPIVLLASALLAVACDTQRENDELEPDPGTQLALDVVLTNIADTQILPGFEFFKSESQTLNNQAQIFCNNINTANLSALQAQWKTLSSQWNRIVIYNFGPLNDDVISPSIHFIESMRANGQDHTNDVRIELANALGGAFVLDESYFDSLLFSETGILALEVLIYESSIGTHSTLPGDIVTDYQSNPRKCEYLLGMGQLLFRHADEIYSAWSNNYHGSGQSYRDIFIKSEKLADDSTPAVALITAIQQHLDYLNTRKLLMVHDAEIADYFFENIQATLDEIENLLEGQGSGTYSVFDHMINGGFGEEVAVVRRNLASAQQAAETGDESTLDTYAGYLDGNFKDEISTGLDVNLGLNFSDGD